MDFEKLNYNYFAFGLHITSSIPITGFNESDFKIADITIHEGKVPDSLSNVINECSIFQSNDCEFLLKLQTIADYYVKGGNTIIIQKCPGISYSDISAYLISTAFGIILHQRKLLPLHASAVLYNNNCILFAGFSGSGKTTLAMSFIQSGASLITDDISAIVFLNKKPLLYPSFPSIKIWEDSLKLFGNSPEGLQNIRIGINKFYLPVNEFYTNAIPLDKIFILQSGNSYEISELKGANKFKKVMEIVFMYHAIKKTNIEKNIFKMIDVIINQIPVFSISRSFPKPDIKSITTDISKFL